MLSTFSSSNCLVASIVSASVILLLNITSFGPPLSELPRPPLAPELVLAGLLFFSPDAFCLSFLRHLKRLKM
ncbi:hypothetical protein GBA52_025927 [Prunus armeniaca]|nr:hypothetical protein GBA52_025927 [Prunus armeniaca]